MGPVGEIVDRENAQTGALQDALPPCIESVVIDDEPVGFTKTVDCFRVCSASRCQDTGSQLA